MTPDRSHCEGCFRTLDDIRAWSKAGNAERRAIWAALLRRAGLALPKELEPAASVHEQGRQDADAPSLAGTALK